VSAEHEGATKRNGARREDASDPVGVVLAKNRTLFFLLIVPSLSIFKIDVKSTAIRRGTKINQCSRRKELGEQSFVWDFLPEA
jgi:hypothetical protein